MSARDEYPLAWQIARSRAHEDTWGEVVSALEEIDRLRAERDTLAIKDLVGDTQSSGLDQAGPGGAVEAERRQDQPEPCDTAAPTSEAHTMSALRAWRYRWFMRRWERACAADRRRVLR